MDGDHTRVPIYRELRGAPDGAGHGDMSDGKK